MTQNGLGWSVFRSRNGNHLYSAHNKWAKDFWIATTTELYWPSIWMLVDKSLFMDCCWKMQDFYEICSESEISRTKNLVHLTWSDAEVIFEMQPLLQ